MAVETKNLPVEKIMELYEAGDLSAIKELLLTLHPTDIARIFEELEREQVVSLFRLLPKDKASDVFLELEDPLKEFLVSAISDKELVEIVDEMETDDATDVISELSHEDARKVLDGIKEKESIEVRKLLKYPEDTAGGKMQAELVSVNESATVKQAVQSIREKAKEITNISNVFVVDDEGKLVGTVSLDKLILADEDTPIREIMNTKPIKVTTDVDQEEVARMFRRYDLLSMPVVDKEGHLVGRITIDDVVDVIEEEIFEDFYRVASLSVEERPLDPPLRSIARRSPWLILNLGTAFVAASVVKLFEDAIASLVILAVLMPVVAGEGGNAAMQTVTVIVRGLALGELEIRSTWRVLYKEALVGLGNGIIVGSVAGLIAYLLGTNVMVGVLLFLSMTVNLFIAGLCGAVIPLVLKWLKADPALSSSIFVTTCTDVAGFFTFLGLGALFIKLGLL